MSVGTFAKPSDGGHAGFYVARIGYSVNLWAHVGVPNPDTHDYWVFVRINRDDGRVLMIQTYDIAEDGMHSEGRGGQLLWLRT